MSLVTGGHKEQNTTSTKWDFKFKRLIFNYFCSEGKLELAAENYKEFVKIAEESGDADVVSQASSSLATLYNMLVGCTMYFSLL